MIYSSVKDGTPLPVDLMLLGVRNAMEIASPERN
jgi:hypothetical protein